MKVPDEVARRDLLEQLFAAAVNAVRGDRLLSQHSELRGTYWHYGDRHGAIDVPLPSGGGRLFVIGAGKASASMASGLEESLGGHIQDAVVITKDGHSRPLRRGRSLEASHPVPDLRSVAATRSLLELLDQTKAQDVVLCLLSGGASSLLSLPVSSVSITDKADANRLLLNSGASIEEINAVRKHLSLVKGGWLRARCSAATFRTLAISDVIGDDPATIGSGPTVADPTTFADALGVIEAYRMAEAMPESVMRHLRRGSASLEPETPKPGDLRLCADEYHVIGSNRAALEAAAEFARRRGCEVRILTDRLSGNSHDGARALAVTLRDIARERRSSSGPLVILAGGETTLPVTGSGKGGRNQEFALVAGMHLQGTADVTVLAAGSDGTDGPTDAAGAFANEATSLRADAVGMDVRRCLAANDAYPLLEAMGDLYKPGPTGTNVMDLVVAVIGKA